MLHTPFCAVLTIPNTYIYKKLTDMNTRINFYLLQTFCPKLGSFCVVSSFTTFRPNFTSGLLQVIFTATSDRNAESCNRIPINYCIP